MKRVDEQRAEYSRRVTAVTNERDMMASRIRALESAASTPDHSAEEKLRIAEAKAEAAASQVQNLQTQLQTLKAGVAMETRMGQQTSDQDISSMMSALNHQLQNWVVNTFRGVKIGKYPSHPYRKDSPTPSRSRESTPKLRHHTEYFLGSIPTSLLHKL